jgi:hypothetical protein
MSSRKVVVSILELGYMDPVAAEQGPGAFMNQQA